MVDDERVGVVRIDGGSYRRCMRLSEGEIMGKKSGAAFGIWKGKIIYSYDEWQRILKKVK